MGPSRLARVQADSSSRQTNHTVLSKVAIDGVTMTGTVVPFHCYRVAHGARLLLPVNSCLPSAIPSPRDVVLEHRLGGVAVAVEGRNPPVKHHQSSWRSRIRVFRRSQVMAACGSRLAYVQPQIGAVILHRPV